MNPKNIQAANHIKVQLDIIKRIASEVTADLDTATRETLVQRIKKLSEAVVALAELGADSINIIDALVSPPMHMAAAKEMAMKIQQDTGKNPWSVLMAKDGKETLMQWLDPFMGMLYDPDKPQNGTIASWDAHNLGIVVKSVTEDKPCPTKSS